MAAENIALKVRLLKRIYKSEGNRIRNVSILLNALRDAMKKSVNICLYENSSLLKKDAKNRMTRRWVSGFSNPDVE